MKRTVLIADDAAFMRMMLKDILTRAKYEVVGEAANGKEAVELQCQLRPDLTLLDISMPVMAGMETARQIRKIDSDVVLLFVTSLSQYAIRGYEVNAMDYILKPVSYFAFSQRLNRAMARVKSHAKNYLIVSTKNGMQKLDISSIYYVESQGHTLILHTRSGDYPCAGTMKEIEQKLEDFHFFRIVP